MNQAKTAIDVYRKDIAPTLHGRQLFVRQQLVAFIDEFGQSPTALELLRFVAAQFPQRTFDCNSIRPRLRECWEQGWVKHGEKRTCAVSGKVVLTWQASTPKPPDIVPIPQRLNLEVSSDHTATGGSHGS